MQALVLAYIFSKTLHAREMRSVSGEDRRFDQNRTVSREVKPICSTYPQESDILASMAIESIIAQLDAEIDRLKQVRNLLSATGKVEAKIPAAKGKPGRKPGVKTSKPGPKPKTGVKRVLSPEARKAIADAQRKRWAAHKAKS